jgi:hypothetical protein
VSEQGNVVDFEKKRIEIRLRRLTERLMAFVNGSEFGAVAAAGLRKFMSETMDEDEEWPDGESAGAQDEADDLENEFIEWLVLDYEDDDVGATLVDTFLASLAEGELDDWEEFSYAQWACSSLSLYEVERLVSGDRVVLRDVLSGRSYDVIAPNIGVGILRWSAVVTRLLAVDDVYTIGATALEIPRPLLRYVLRVVGHVYRNLRVQGYEGSWGDFLKGSGLSLRRLARLMLSAWNSDGERIRDDDDDTAGAFEAGAPAEGAERQFEHPKRTLYRSFIKVDDVGRATQAVLRIRGVRDVTDGSEFAWIRPQRSQDQAGVAPYGPDDVALIRIDGDTFTVYAESRSTLGVCVSLMRKATAGYAAAQGRTRKRGPLRSDEKQAVIARIDSVAYEAMVEHYASWADTPLPLLLGSSPRDAVQSGLGRRLVAELLKDVDYHENLKRRAGVPWVDVADLWRQVTSEEHAQSEIASAAALGPKEWSVASLLDEMMRRDGYTEDQIFASAKMWCDYVNRERPNVVHASTWAAAVEYASAVSQNEPVTQASVARKYEVSVSTLSQRYRQIMKSLEGYGG